MLPRQMFARALDGDAERKNALGRKQFSQNGTRGCEIPMVGYPRINARAWHYRKHLSMMADSRGAGGTAWRTFRELWRFR